MVNDYVSQKGNQSVQITIMLAKRENSCAALLRINVFVLLLWFSAEVQFLASHLFV